MAYDQPTYAAAAQPSAGNQATSPTHQDAFQRGIQDVIDKRALKRVWFRAENNGQTLVNFDLGGARADAQIPVGSISKSIAGIDIALLIQDGKLALQSKVSDVLAGVYARHQRPMHASMADITIARLLSHTAGLRANWSTDPRNGLDAFDGIDKLGDNATAFDYLVDTDTDRSSGQSTFLYSNISYLMLGLIIEVISQENYETFCKRRILAPVEIKNAALLGGKLRPIAPYIGWALTRQEILQLWRSVFNPEHPSILTRRTLEATFLVKLGTSPAQIPDARYTLGIFVRSNSDNSAYRIWHNDLHKSFSSYAEDTRPGPAWMVQWTPALTGGSAGQMREDIRALVDRLSQA